MPKFIDLTGQKFGRWTVLNRNATYKFGGAQFLCLCECGNKKTVPSKSLRDGSSKSCGCLNIEIRRQICIERNTTHNMSGTKVYDTWTNMIQRCHNKKCSGYKKYGSRGILVCPEWHTFENFYEDMGDPPSSNHTIDRIDPTKGYSPDNCRWATMKEQQNNRTNNRLITFNGKTKTLAQWSELTGICRSVISYRLKKDWTIERALTEKTVKGRNQYS